jgi:cytoskeletal protein CcmA (bactofilin family)
MWNRETNNRPNTVPNPAPYTPEPAPQPISPEPAVAAAPVKAKGSTLVMKGELSGSEDLAIEGKVEGKIALPEHVLTVGLGAQVAAEIIARVVILHGSVTGNITAYERVEVKATGRMNGDLVTPKVQMSDGATFTGRLETRNPAKGNAREKATPKPELVAV